MGDILVDVKFLTFSQHHCLPIKHRNLAFKKKSLFIHNVFTSFSKRQICQPAGGARGEVSDSAKLASENQERL